MTVFHSEHEARDANSWDEEERRREQFGRWLLRAWEWAIETRRTPLADRIAELVSHVEEPDYPIWEAAEREGLTGDTRIARLLRHHCGTYPDGPRACNWEREINYAPVIMLEEPLWRRIHGMLGWVTRSTDTYLRGRNFFLWSPAGNIVRFVMRQEEKTHGDE